MKNVHSVSTDNADVRKKVSLRSQAVAGLGSLRVLDLFAGNNVLWSHFDCERYYGVEAIKGKGRNLHADNVRVIDSLDLSGFNVIDLDSYGVPANAVDKIFKNKSLQAGTIIIYTCISSGMCRMSKAIIREFGLNSIYNKSKVLVNALAHDLFYGLLYNRGVRRVYKYTERTTFIKDYGYFVVGGDV